MSHPVLRRFLPLLLVMAAAQAEDGGVMPRMLCDPSAPEAKRQLTASDGAQAETSPEGIVLRIAAGPNPYPGITLVPVDGKPWALNPYGHVEAAITNTGAQPATINLRVDDAGPGEAPWNAESAAIAPGETRTIRVYFGYSYGFRKGHALKTEAVTRLLFFTGAAATGQSFRIAKILAAGSPGEPPGKQADAQRHKPAGGVLVAGRDGLGLSVRGAVVLAADAVQATWGDGDGTLVVRPATGLWDLGEWMQVSVRLRNPGERPLRPRLRLTSDNGDGTAWCDAAEIAPGAEAAVSIPFAPATAWLGVSLPVQSDPQAKGNWSNQPGTGTGYRSHRTAALEVQLPSAGTLAVLKAVAEDPPAALPDWLGSRPPVEGAWTRTLSEEFDGDYIDAKRWNVQGYNWWDKRQHFSREQLVVADGKLRLRVERKPGFHNDDPTAAKSDYASAWADTWGKWTQRYGYIEVRAKLPTAPCLWPGVWMMPDRGLARFPTSDPKKDWQAYKSRGTQEGSGMEFDIIEAQTIWGPHRFNIAMHWDGYAQHHKVIGTGANYVPTDRDGFIVVGMLWLPGSMAIYGNGREIWRWESPRIPDTQQHLILQNLIGGWETEELDDSRLPADLVLDYIRAWQRADLATPEDGAKPNAGGANAWTEKP